MKSYDYIVIGAGASGLLLADALGREPWFRERSILILEKSDKLENDRSWCFWEEGPGPLDALLHDSWDYIRIQGAGFNLRQPLAPFRYKMIQAIDFYQAYRKRLEAYPNIHWERALVHSVTEEEGGVWVHTQTTIYKGGKVFNSIFSLDALQNNKKYPLVLQHFTGWFVETTEPVFDPGTVTFMDFSIPQQGNTRFMYLLPFAPTRALVEYTLFSPELLPEQEYTEALNSYMVQRLQGTSYSLSATERGIIPMSCYPLETHNRPNLLHIGIAGGWAKPSTGYTFKNSLRNTAKLVSHLKEGKPLTTFSVKDRFWYYDLLLVDILFHDNARGSVIFQQLFQKRDPALILKFLDGETNFWEDLKVIWACPKKDFLRALVRRLF